MKLNYEDLFGHEQDGEHPSRAALRELLALPDRQPCAGADCEFTHVNVTDRETGELLYSHLCLGRKMELTASVFAPAYPFGLSGLTDP